MQIWWPVYLRRHDKDNVGQIRAVTLVSRKIVTDSWLRLNVKSTDIVVISLEIAERTVCIFNIYNNGEHLRSMQAINFFLRSVEGRRTRGRNIVDIWVRDFNRHHLMWDHLHNLHLFMRANLDAVLIATAMRHGVSMALWPHVVTLQAKNIRNLMGPDNIFITDTFYKNVTQCKMLYSDQLPKADNFPIVMRCEERLGRNYKEVNWADFEEELGRNLEGVRKGRIQFKEEVETRLDAVMGALEKIVEAKVLVRRKMTRMKR
ncbi:hypothetical protein J132_09063 [Termitomyces sp. J132]|nr:hypothetical protein J132_09063 [Termitomyces sp. J132]